MGCIRPRAAFTRSLSAIRSVITWPMPSAGRGLRPIARRSAPGMARGLPPEGPESAREGWVPKRPVSRVLFRRRVTPAKALVIPLGRPLLAGSSTLTRTPRHGRCHDDRADRSRRCPYSSLLREGLAPPPVTRLSRVGSYPTFSPLPPRPRTSGGRPCVFCGTFPGVTPGGRYPPPCPVEPGLSSPGTRVPAAILHPPPASASLDPAPT